MKGKERAVNGRELCRQQDARKHIYAYVHIYAAPPDTTPTHCRRTGTLLLFDRQQHLPRTAGTSGDDDDADG